LRGLQRLLLLASVLGSPRIWADEAHNKVSFNLPSGEFPEVILEFYRQSKIEVLFLAKDSLSAIHTQPVVGEYEPREALDIMLRGTGLVYNFATEHSVSIKQLPPPEEPPPPPKKIEHHGASGPQTFHGGEMELVTVTGSLIRGALDVRAPIVDVTPKDLSFAPFPTIQDALYELPMVSLDVPREDLGINNNYNFGAAINLRGLGVGATLTLVNGRRQPLSGSTSDFVDVSNIPVAAVDHIEILPQGASAIYGSDAIAGVVNIILRDHFDGAKTSVQYGGAPGGRDNVTVSQLLGTHWGSGNALLVYQYSDATQLPMSARGYASSANKQPYGGGDYRSFYAAPGNVVSFSTLLPISSSVNYENAFAQYDLFPQATQHSVYGTAKEEIGKLELFAEGRFTQRSTYAQHIYEDERVTLGADNPFNPFPGSLTLVDYSFSKAFGPITFADETRNYVGTLGARLNLGADWQATLSETYGQERLYADEYNEVNLAALSTAANSANATSAFNPFGATNFAVLDSIRAAFLQHANSSIEATSLVADGPVFNLPTGSVKLAAGVERRKESLRESNFWTGQPSPEQPSVDNRFSRHVGSAFTELAVPLIGDPSNRHAAPRLELTMAGRYDNYSDFGHTINPEFGVHWAPLDSLKLRASWGRSYRAPKLDDLYDTSNNLSGLAVLPDPQSPSKQSPVLVIQGNNPKLRPETAKSWTAGFDVVPDADPDLALSLTYYSVDFTGQITTPDVVNPFGILAQENEWSEVITRNPTAAQVAAVCNRPDFRFSTVAECLASTPAAIIDYRLANLSSTQTDGLDVNIHQKLRTEAGLFELGLIGNYVFHFNQELSSTSPAVEILNTYGNPLKFRFRATAAWDRHLPGESGLGASLAMNFTNAYHNLTSTQSPDIGSFTTIDLQLRYHTAESSGWLGGMDFALNAINVFNQSPPFVDNVYGFDNLNAQPLGRVLRVSVSKKW